MLQGCRLFKRCRNLPAGHCVAGVQTFKGVSEPTCQALCCMGAGCLSSVGIYLMCTMLQGCRLFKWCRNLPAEHCVAECRLFKWCQNLPAGHCVAVVQAVKAVSEPTCWALHCRGSGCLSGLRSYQVGTVLQGCRLFKRCQNLPAGHCVAWVQAVKAVKEPIWLALCYRVAGCWNGVGTYLPSTMLQSAGCLSGVRTYLLGTVLQGCRLFKLCQKQPAGTVLQECWLAVFADLEPTFQALCCRLVKPCQNLPPRLCKTGEQAVKVVSETTSRALLGKGAGCLSRVRTYLPGTVLQWCRLFKRCQNLPARHCATVVQIA